MKALAGAGTFHLLVYTASDAAVPTEWDLLHASKRLRISEMHPMPYLPDGGLVNAPQHCKLMAGC